MQQRTLHAHVIFARLCLLVAALWVWPALGELPKFAKAQMGSDRFGVESSAFAVGLADRLATATRVGHIRLWDTARKRLLWEVQPTSNALAALAFAGSSGVVALTQSNDVMLLSNRDGSEVRRFPIQPCNKPCEVAAAFATDKVLLTAGVLDGEGGDDEETTTLRVWSLSDGKLLQSRTVAKLSQLMLSPDGAHVAWIMIDAEASVLASTANLERAAPLSGCDLVVASEFEDEVFHGFPVLLQFSPDGRTLAQVDPGREDNSRVHVCFWDVVGGVGKNLREGTLAVKPKPEEEEDMPPSPVPITALFSLDGAQLRVVYELVFVMRTTSVWGNDSVRFDVATGKVSEEPRYDWQDNPQAAWIDRKSLTVPDHRGDTGEVYLRHSREDGTGVAFPPLEMLAGHHTRSVVKVSASHDGALVASTDMAGKTLIWSKGTLAPLNLKADGVVLFDAAGGLLHFEPAQLPSSEAYCPVEERVGSVGRWDLRTLAYLSLRQDPKLMVRAAVNLPDGDMLTCRDQHSAEDVDCGNIPNGPVKGIFERWKPDASVKATYDKAAFDVCAQSQGVSVASERAVVADFNKQRLDFDARVIDLASGATLMALPKIDSWERTALSPDGKHVAAIHSADESISIRPFTVDGAAAKDPLIVQTPEALPYRATYPAVVFSPDSRAMVYSDGASVVVRAVDGAATISLKGHTGPVTALAFSGDGKTLVSAQSEGIIYTWDWVAISAALATP